MTAEIISALAAVAAAIVAIFAALAAFRSASAAERTAKTTALAERRSMLREIVSSAQGILDEAQAIDALAKALDSLHAAYCVFVGSGTEASARDLFAAELAEGLSPVPAIKEYARRFADDYPGLSRASEDDLSNTQARLAADLARLRRIVDDMRWRRDDLAGKCAAQREFRLRQRS